MLRMIGDDDRRVGRFYLHQDHRETRGWFFCVMNKQVRHRLNNQGAPGMKQKTWRHVFCFTHAMFFASPTQKSYFWNENEQIEGQKGIAREKNLIFSTLERLLIET